MRERPGHLAPGPAAAAALRRGGRARGRRCGAAYQRPTTPSTTIAGQRGDREPGDAALAVRQHDERRQQRPERDCRNCRPPGRCSAPGRNARRRRAGRRATPPGGTRCEPSPTMAAASSSDQKCAGMGQQQQPAQRGAHADGERIRHRPAVGVGADQRLQQRRGDLERERDQADLAEVERVVLLQDRVDRRQQRLDHVVQQMREADRVQHRECRPGRHGRHCFSPGVACRRRLRRHEPSSFRTSTRVRSRATLQTLRRFDAGQDRECGGPAMHA